MTANITLALSGLACMALSVFMFVALKPRAGKPVSAWVSTDTRASASVLLVLVLGMVGVTLVAKAFA